MSARLVVATALLAACGGGKGGTTTTTPPARAIHSAKEIAADAKPAIVRVEGGDARVGTGFIVDATGLVVTNLHVVMGQAAIRIKLLDGSTLPVLRIAAVDADRDLVVLDVDPPAPLPILALGSSKLVAAGDPVVAIGNPLGVLDYTVSDGLISSVRPVTPDLTLLQISAPISQGSSGGPLFNAYGEVIGITQAIFTEGQNLNFAIPSDYLAPLIQGKAPALTMAEFAERTTPPPETAAGAPPKIVRQVPKHEVKLLDGCPDAAAAEAIQLIDETIQLGARLFNAGDHEECARVYEQTSQQLATKSACPGIRTAFEAGLARAATAPTATEKAWALRDAFDGLLDVIYRRATGGPPPP